MAPWGESGSEVSNGRSRAASEGEKPRRTSIARGSARGRAGGGSHEGEAAAASRSSSWAVRGVVMDASATGRIGAILHGVASVDPAMEQKKPLAIRAPLSVLGVIVG